MKYRIYVCFDRGYKLVHDDISKKNFIKIMDTVISKWGDNKILVIGHDEVVNCDVPVFLNIVDDYSNFRSNNVSKKVRRKKENDIF